MSTLEQEIEKWSIKNEQATQKFNELRDLLNEVSRDLEIIREYQKHFQEHLNSANTVKTSDKH